MKVSYNLNHLDFIPLSNSTLQAANSLTRIALHIIIEGTDEDLSSTSTSPSTVRSTAPTPPTVLEEKGEGDSLEMEAIGERDSSAVEAAQAPCFFILSPLASEEDGEGDSLETEAIDEQDSSAAEATPAQAPRFSILSPLTSEEDVIHRDMEAIQRLSLNVFFLEKSGCVIDTTDTQHAYTLIRDPSYPLSNRVKILRHWTAMEHMIKFHKLYLGEGGVKRVYCASSCVLANLENTPRGLVLKNVQFIPPAERGKYARGEVKEGVVIDEGNQREIAKICAENPNILSGPIIVHLGKEGKRQLCFINPKTKRTLADAAEQRLLSRQDLIHHGKEIASQLAHLHSKGLAHRDLKPDNIFYTTNAHIGDFDYGELFKQGSIPSKRVGKGTFPYFSPECIQACLEKRCLSKEEAYASDIFAFGMIMYELYFLYSKEQKKTQTAFYKRHELNTSTREGIAYHLYVVANLEKDYLRRFPKPTSEDTIEHLIWRMMHPDLSIRPNSREVASALARL
jgi:hypothetical protein